MVPYNAKLKWYIRTLLIALFCSFTILFYTSIHTFLGWAADQEDIPEKIAIHWVIIKEPNKVLKFDNDIVIIELGSGTGVITKEIINRMSKNSKLICFETNISFYNDLKEKFKDNICLINDSF